MTDVPPQGLLTLPRRATIGAMSLANSKRIASRSMRESPNETPGDKPGEMRLCYFALELETAPLAGSAIGLHPMSGHGGGRR